MESSKNDFNNSQEEGLDLKQEIRKYLSYWPWYILTFIIAVACAYVYLRYTPRIYTTNAKIKVLDESDGIEMPTTAFIFKKSNINLENEIEIIKSYIVMERVVKTLNLNTSFSIVGNIQTTPLADLPLKYEQLLLPDQIKNNLSYKISVNKIGFDIVDTNLGKTYNFPNHTTHVKKHNLPFNISLLANIPLANILDQTYIIKFTTLSNATLTLKSKIKVSPVGDGSDILNVSISGQNKKRCQRILNTVLEIFNNDGVNDRQSISKRTLDFIEERFVLLETELDSIEVNRKDFKQKNNIIDIASDAEIGVQQRSQSDEKVFEIQRKLALAQLMGDALADSSKSELLPANIGIDNNGLNRLIDNYNTVLLEKIKLTSSGGENNPKVKLLDTKIKDIRVNIEMSLAESINQLKVSQNQMLSRNIEFSNLVSALPNKEKLLRAIERQQKIKESLYILLLQKREEAAINLAITEPSIKVVEYAISAYTPVSPRSNYVYLAAIFLGLLIPVGVVYFKYLLDTKIHTKEDIKKIAPNVPIIAEIPDIKNEKNKVFSNPNNKDALSESFRILSSNINFILPESNEDKGKVIYCTSTIKGEGKTFVSLNLSLAMSSINKKILLIGSDLRNPQIHTHINLSKNHLGVSNYLYNRSFDWRDGLINCFKKHKHHNILLSGSIPPNPTHLLTNGRFQKLLEEARLEYDYIIVDTAPTILVTDTMLISEFADATIFVTRADHTDKKLLNFSKDLSETNKIKNMTYVINAVGTNKAYGYRYGYGYKYTYNYGYGYGYESDS